MTVANWFALGSFGVGLMGFIWGLLKTYAGRVQAETEKVAAEVRSLRDVMSDDIRKLDERLRIVETTKVSHADWVRVSTSQLNRMNRLSEQLAEVSGKIDASIGMAGAVNRIASAIEKQAEES